MADWDLVLTDARLATMQRGGAAFGVIEDGAVAIADGTLAWVGRRGDLPRGSAADTRSLAGRWVTPALIDCHTHLVFGGDRAAEFEQRLGGTSYEEIARTGGGILATVRATRESASDALYATALARLRRLMAGGVATVEVKSGYGLDVDTEIRMLEVARRLHAETEATVVATLLAAHAVPPELAPDADAWIDRVCESLLPVAAERRLADAVDAYCETIAFSADQIRKVFHRAREFGLPVKLHADQLSDGGGALLAANCGALSADHLEYSAPAGLAAMARAGCVAVLLPGAYLTLGETRRPPVDALRRFRVPIAVATDLNPGTSPLLSLPEAMALAARIFELTPEECLAGVTREAARALGLADRGMLETGLRADLAIWEFERPQELAYWLGGTAPTSLLIAGRDVSLAAS
ncbi:MAG: imidazolonepropionase [Woeseiaceae bacterium]